MCGIAKNEYTMIVGRVIAGAGGGGMTTISSIVASDLVPLRKRGIVQGGGNLSYGVGAALGGVFGGFIHDRIGWRWAFLIQVCEPLSMEREHALMEMDVHRYPLSLYPQSWSLFLSGYQ